MPAKNQEPAEVVVRALLDLQGDPEKVAEHMKQTRIRVLGNRTIEQALSDGDAGKVLRYLQTISGGQNG